MESSWYKVVLTDQDILEHKHMDLQREFMSLYMNFRAPKDTYPAMFDSSNTVDGHHFYFSPAAAVFCGALIHRWGGKKCDRPLASDVGALLVGHPSAREVLLSEKGKS